MPRTPGTNPPPLFNSNPYMNLKHGRERYQGGVFAKYEWSEKATLYTDFMFMKDQANTAVAPSGLFIGDVIPVFCNNSLMSAQQADGNRLRRGHDRRGRHRRHADRPAQHRGRSALLRLRPHELPGDGRRAR